MIKERDDSFFEDLIDLDPDKPLDTESNDMWAVDDSEGAPRNKAMVIRGRGDIDIDNTPLRAIIKNVTDFRALGKQIITTIRDDYDKAEDFIDLTDGQLDEIISTVKYAFTKVERMYTKGK